MRRAAAALVLVLLCVPAKAWEVANVGSSINSDYHEAFSAITPDGLTLLISSDRPGGYGEPERGVFWLEANYDIYVAHRDSLESARGPVINLGPNINTSASEHSPMLSPDGHYLYFMSARPGGFGGEDIYRSYREDATDDRGWGPAENLGPGVNGPYVDSCPVFFTSEDGSAYLFYVQGAGPEPDTIDFRISELNANTFEASRPVEISTLATDAHLDPWHGLIWGMGYPDGFGGSDLYLTERIPGERDLTRSWTSPINFGSGVNTEYEETMPSAVSDGSRLYFMSDRPGGQGGMDIYEAVNEMPH